MQHKPSWRLPLFWLTLVLVVGPSIAHAAPTSSEAAVTQVKKSDLAGVKNFSRTGGAAGFGGATQPSAMAALSEQGFASVINLRLATEPNVDVDGSRAAAEKAGLKYIHLPFDSANPDPQLVEKFLAVVKDPANQPPYIHCASANRVGVLWMIKRVLADDWEIGRAREEAQAIGMKGPQANLFAVNYIMSHKPSQAMTQQDRGFGDVHMDVSCDPALADDFDAALALLHNFWYARALEAFTHITKTDPECSMAYWGAAMTYNHPFWDPPTEQDLAAAWKLVQRGLKATNQTPREKMYIDAVAALYKDAGVGHSKADRDTAYLAAMKAAAEQYPDDETRLFYGQMLLSTMPEGAVSNEIQPVVASILEEVYGRKPTHPGVLHYLTHVYDDPVNAEKGLIAARAYAKSAASVPHAHHMPSHIFARLGLWEESATSNENAWRISEADVAHAGEEGQHRDFHALNYLQSAYLQLGRYRDAEKLTRIFKAEYDGLANKQTAPDSPVLQAKHVKGRTIFGLPDRVAFGYFDTLVRYLIETGNWESFGKVPLVAPSRDFVAMKTLLKAAAAARSGDAPGAKAAAEKLAGLSQEPGQDPFVKVIITLQAREAEGFAAFVARDEDAVIEKMEAAGKIEDSIAALSQPSYPALPAREIYGNMLMEMNRPAAAMVQYLKTLERTPRRPKSIYGIARAAAALGDKQTATERFTEFLEIWKNADEDRPELAIAREYLDPTRKMSDAGFPSLPTLAPDWQLTTTDGTVVSNADYRGSGLLLILHRGLDCLFCSEQLASLAGSVKEFSDRGIGIVAVAPHWPITSESDKARKELLIDFPLAVDPSREVFRNYGCFERPVLHGAFLIDADGFVQWQAIGEKPVMEVERLLAAADDLSLAGRMVRNDASEPDAFEAAAQ